MRNNRRLRQVLWIAMVFVAVSVVAGWVAIGRLASATELGLQRVEESLVVAVDLADSTAASAAEVQRVVAVVGDGLGSTGESLAATRQVSANVRNLLGLVGFIGRVDDLAESLKEAEASLQGVEADLAAAQLSVQEADPILAETVRSLEAIPGEIRASVAQVKTSREQIGAQVLLWRMAMAASGIALLLLIGVVERLIADRDAMGASADQP